MEASYLLLLIPLFYLVVSLWKKPLAPLKPGTTILITGGAQGLGKLMALTFARHKPSLILIVDIQDHLAKAAGKETQIVYSHSR